MPNPYFRFKQFTIYHDRCAMKVTTDACLFGAWCAVEIKNAKFKIKNVLDIGMGTGLLPLMVVQKNPTLLIDAIEIDNGACSQAKDNIKNTPWQQQINTICADVKNYPFLQLFDCIISNPPFYENELKSSSAQKNLALHSDALGLNDLLNIIKKHLNPLGYFFLLLPYKREKDIALLLEKHQLFIHKKLLVQQSEKHSYFRIFIKGGLSATSEIIMEELAIWNHEKTYTTAFIALLKDYYLHL